MKRKKNNRHLSDSSYTIELELHRIPIYSADSSIHLFLVLYPSAHSSLEKNQGQEKEIKRSDASQKKESYSSQKFLPSSPHTTSFTPNIARDRSQ